MLVLTRQKDESIINGNIPVGIYDMDNIDKSHGFVWIAEFTLNARV